MKTPEQIVAAWREGCRHCMGGDYGCTYCLADAMVALELSIYATRPLQKTAAEPFPDDDPFLPKRMPGHEHDEQRPGGRWSVVLVVLLLVFLGLVLLLLAAALAALGAA